MSLSTIVSASAGLTFATSCFVAAVQVAHYLVGNSAWLAILVSGLFCLLAAACFSELNGMLPSAAGIRLYFARAFNDRMAITVSLLYMGVVASVIGAESYVLSQVLGQAVPRIPPFAWIVLLQGTVVVLNLRGVKLAGRFQEVITYSLVSSLLILGLIALAHQGFSPPNPLKTGGTGNFLSAVAVGVFLFIGFEWVTPLAEEVTQVRFIALGMLIAVGILSVSYAIFTVAMSSTVSTTALAASPVPHMIFAEKLLGRFGLIWMVGISLAASVTTFNAGLLSLSRFAYSSAREHVLPSALSKISRRYFTPWVAILTVFGFGLLASAIVYLSKGYLVLVNVGAATEALIYLLVGCAVLTLRRKEPQANRPFRIKGGILIPVLTVLIFGLLVVVVLAQNPAASLYLVIAVLAATLYVDKVVPRLKDRAKARRLANAARRSQQASR